jgi:hypothetical protein
VTRPGYQYEGPNGRATQRSEERAPAVHPARSPILPSLSAGLILLGLPCLLGDLPRWPFALGLAFVLLTSGMIVFATYLASYVMMRHAVWVADQREARETRVIPGDLEP